MHACAHAREHDAYETVIEMTMTHLLRDPEQHGDPTPRPQPLLRSTTIAPSAVTANSINTSVHLFESRTRTASTPGETIEMTSTKTAAVHSSQVKTLVQAPPLSPLGMRAPGTCCEDGIANGHGIFLHSVTP